MSPTRRAVLILGGLGAQAGCTRGSTSGDTSTPAATVTTTVPPSSTSPASSSPSAASSSSSVPKPTLTTLNSQLSRPLLTSSSPGYAAAVRLYSPRFDSAAHPRALARCTDSDDVAHCIRFAAEAGVPFALRAGGHSYGGWSTTSGLQIDTTAMSSVRIDRSARTATVGAGARLIDVYAQLGSAGFALAAGSCPTVGLTGLALGGGVGVLTRAFGLTCDSLRGAQIVTADGKLRTIDSKRDSDLFWSLRGGGGGSFGAVTSLTFALQPAPTVQTFYYSFDFARAAEVLDAWQRWVPGTDRRLWSTCKLLVDPPSGSRTVSVSGTWIGAAGDLSGVLAPLLQRTGSPAARNVNSLSYVQAMLLEAGCSGQDASSCTSAALSSAQRLPFAATSSMVARTMSSSAVSTAVAQASRAASVPGLKEGGVSFDALGGAVSALPASATPFPYRSAIASVQYTATWTDTTAAATPFDSYVRGFRSAMRPFLGTAAYVNYADASISDYGGAYWGANYERLQQVKKNYDPHSLFTFAQAVRPA